jgi:Holliday junction resolvase
MPSKSKRKGNKFERDCVNIAKEYGIKAKRAWGSDGRSMGFEEDVDMLLDETIKVQCKIRKKLAKWVLPPESCDIAVVREDRGETYVTISYVDYLSLIRTVILAREIVDKEEANEL